MNPVANNVLMSRTWLDGAVCLNPAVCIPGDGLVQGNPLLAYPNGEILSFNANAVARERYTLRNYLQPVGVQLGRLVKLTMQLNF